MLTVACFGSTEVVLCSSPSRRSISAGIVSNGQHGRFPTSKSQFESECSLHLTGGILAITSGDYPHDANVGTNYGKQTGTRQVVINAKTEFSNWIRQFGDKNNPRYRPLLDTWANTYRVYDVDYVVWKKVGNDGAGPYMFIEEKVHDARMRHDQALLYFKLDSVLGEFDSDYMGFHYIRFENTTPDNGLVFLDEKMIEVEDLLLFIELKQPGSMYKSWFEKLNDDGINWRNKIQT